MKPNGKGNLNTIVLSSMRVRPEGKGDVIRLFDEPHAFTRMGQFVCKGVLGMETRIALIGIIVEDTDASAQINPILHEYGDCIVGRMGIPYRDKGVSIISVVVDATNDVISSLSGKLGMIDGVSTKTVYSKCANE